MTAREFIEIMTNTTWYYGPSIHDGHDEEYGIDKYLLDHIDLPEKDETLEDIYEIRYSLLQSLHTTGQLRILYDEIIHDEELYDFLPAKLREVIKKFLEPEIKTRSVTYHHNEPIDVILNLYNEKKSRKVAYARGQLRIRYDGQSYIHQKKILNSFLTNGNANDRKWAAKKLYYAWDKNLSGSLKSAWEKYNEKSVGITVLKYLPETYTVTQIQKFENAGLERRYIYAKLGNSKDFPYEISLNTLNWIDYFYVMAKLERPVQEEIAQEIMLLQLSLVSKRHYEGEHGFGETENLIFHPGITSYKDMGLLIWSFARLGLSSSLLSLYDIAKTAHSFKSDNVYEYSLKLNHMLVGEERPLPLFGDLWADPSSRKENVNAVESYPVSGVSNGEYYRYDDEYPFFDDLPDF